MIATTATLFATKRRRTMRPWLSPGLSSLRRGSHRLDAVADARLERARPESCSSGGLRWFGSIGGRNGSSSDPHPRVERGVGEVSEEVEAIAVIAMTRKYPITGLTSVHRHPLMKRLPMPADREDRLGDDGAAEQRADVGRHERRDRDQHVAERVTHDDRALGKALGARGADVSPGRGPRACRSGSIACSPRTDEQQLDRRQQQVRVGVDPRDPEVAAAAPGSATRRSRSDARRRSST